MDRIRCTEIDYKNERLIMNTLLTNVSEPQGIPMWDDKVLAEVSSWRSKKLTQMDRLIVCPYDYKGDRLWIEIKARFIQSNWLRGLVGPDRGIFMGFDKFLLMAKLAEEQGGASFYVVGLDDCIVAYRFTSADAAQVYANGLEALRIARTAKLPSKGYDKYFQRLTHVLQEFKGRWPKVDPSWTKWKVEPGRRADRLSGGDDAAGEENRVTLVVPFDEFVVASEVAAAGRVNAHPSVHRAAPTGPVDQDFSDLVP